MGDLSVNDERYVRYGIQKPRDALAKCRAFFRSNGAKCMWQ